MGASTAVGGEPQPQDSTDTVQHGPSGRLKRFLAALPDAYYLLPLLWGACSVLTLASPVKIIDPWLRTALWFNSGKFLTHLLFAAGFGAVAFALARATRGWRIALATACCVTAVFPTGMIGLVLVAGVSSDMPSRSVFLSMSAAIAISAAQLALVSRQPELSNRPDRRKKGAKAREYKA